MPCSVPPTLWVETFETAALQALYTFAEPDKKEVYHQVSGNSVLCSYKQVVHDAQQTPNFDKTPLTRGTFKILELIDQKLWWTFVLDVVADGLFNWTSQILQLTNCDALNRPYTASSSIPFGAIRDQGNYGVPYEWDGVLNGVRTFFYPSVRVRAGGSWFIGCYANAAPFGSMETVGIKIRIIDSNGTVYDENSSVKRSDGDHTPAQTFFGGKNETGDFITYSVEMAADDALPLGEAFPLAGFCVCYPFPESP